MLILPFFFAHRPQKNLVNATEKNGKKRGKQGVQANPLSRKHPVF